MELTGYSQGRRKLLNTHSRVRGPDSHLRKQRKQRRIEEQHEQVGVASLLIERANQRAQRSLAGGGSWAQ